MEVFDINICCLITILE